VMRAPREGAVLVMGRRAVYFTRVCKKLARSRKREPACRDR
jgi:hypothetical protein